ncbi:aspartate/glutamate racemase family protein [Moorellaceae bacterium AZ2]
MRELRVLDVFPNVYRDEFREDLIDRQRLSQQLEEQTNGLVKLDIVFMEKGNASIECMYDEAMAAPYVLQKVKWAEEQGYDAVVIDCFLDVALDAARELVEIPVMAPCQSSCNLAARLAGRFSIISILPELDRPIRANLARYGLSQALVSIPVINVPVLDLQHSFELLVERIVKIAADAVTKEGARAVVFGCTGMSPMVQDVQRGLQEKGIKVPVIEPLRAAICDAVACLLLGVSQSKEAYKPVRPKYRLLDWEA